MIKYSYLLITTLFIQASGCISPEGRDKTIPDTTITKTGPFQPDSETDSPVVKYPDSITSDIKPKVVPIPHTEKNEENIADDPPAQQDGLKHFLKELKAKWAKVPNPIIATYKGNDFGDYHHILFEDEKGETYDFGQAANYYGKYQLHELAGQYNDNPAYLGRKFKIYWAWKISKFLCCEGEYNQVSAKLPSISKLILLKK